MILTNAWIWLNCAILIVFTTAHEGHHAHGEPTSSIPPGKATILPNPLYRPLCTTWACDGPLAPFYCRPRLLSLAWHLEATHNCSGTNLRTSVAEAKAALDALPEVPSLDAFRSFCGQHFESESPLEEAALPDWAEEPRHINAVADATFRHFAEGLHRQWPSLARKFRSEVHLRPELYPMVPLPHPFVVPGGFFQSYYYWDSFWIIRGLLFGGLRETAKGIILNFASLIQKFEYIPNGGLLILSKRSQPPYFAKMVNAYVNETHDYDLLKDVIEALDAEMDWWLENRALDVFDSSGKKHRVFRFNVAMDCPRPEAYAQDVKDAEHSHRNKTQVWAAIASGAESGWDFSSRWFAYSGPNAGHKPSIRTPRILPADLNALMAANFRLLADFHSRLGSRRTTLDRWRAFANNTRVALNALFWDEKDGIWYDQELVGTTRLTATPRRRFYPSNFAPLGTGAAEPKMLARVADYADKSGAFSYPGGVPSSMHKGSGQQWDFPNAWAPLIHDIVINFERSGHPKLVSLGLSVAERWLSSTYRGWLSTEETFLWEKYDVESGDGRPGRGGEYAVQRGFGWTNGVALDLLWVLGDRVGYAHPQRISFSISALSSVDVIAASALFAVVVVIAFLLGHRRSNRLGNAVKAVRIGRGAYGHISTPAMTLYSDSEHEDNDTN